MRILQVLGVILLIVGIVVNPFVPLFAITGIPNVMNKPFDNQTVVLGLNEFLGWQVDFSPSEPIFLDSMSFYASNAGMHVPQFSAEFRAEIAGSTTVYGRFSGSSTTSGWIEIPLNSLNVSEPVTIRFVVESRADTLYIGMTTHRHDDVTTYDDRFVAGMTGVGKVANSVIGQGPAFILAGHTGQPDPDIPVDEQPNPDPTPGDMPVETQPATSIIPTDIRMFASIGLVVVGVVLILLGRRS